MRLVAGISMPEPGDRVVIEHDGHATHGQVLAVYPTDMKAKVCFHGNPNHWLSVPISMLGQGPTISRHRTLDMDTARAAADLTPGAISAGQRKVLFALADAGPAGLLDHDHQRLNGLKQTSAGKRRVELVRMGLVEDTGERRPTGRTASAAAWRLTPAGRDLAASMRRRGVA